MNKTDAEIEKALECCFDRDFEDCNGCPLENEFDELFTCMDTRNRLTLDCINRLKAEVERKTKLIAEIDDQYAKFREAAKKRERASVKCIERTADEEIRRLKAENKRLKKHSKEVAENCTQLLRLNDKETNKRFLEAIENVKAEAIKEFAERLTDRICENVNRSLDNPNGNNYYPIDVYNDIDNLVKEMTENEGKE